MNRKIVLKISLVAFTILAIFSLPMLYSVAIQPDKYVSYSYNTYGYEEGKYSYTLHLTPNIIYNRQEIKNIDTAYRRVVESIEISFTNDLIYQKIGDINISYYTLVTLSSPNKWIKTIYSVKNEYTLNNVNESNYIWTHTLNMSQLDSLIKEIEDETGSRSSTYVIKIASNIKSVYMKGEQSYSDSFKPILEITVNKLSDNGDIISFKRNYITSNLVDKNVSETPNYQKKPNSYLYGSLTVLSLVGLGATLFIYNKNYEIPLPKKKPVDIVKSLKENRDIIIQLKSGDLSNSFKSKTLIKTRSFKDLVKTSDILSQPILLVNMEDGIRLYVIDGDKVFTYGE